MANTTGPFASVLLGALESDESDSELDVSGEVQRSESDRDRFVRGEIDQDEFIEREVERALSHLVGEVPSEKIELMRNLLSEEMRANPVFTDLIGQLERRAS